MMPTAWHVGKPDALIDVCELGKAVYSSAAFMRSMASSSVIAMGSAPLGSETYFFS